MKLNAAAQRNKVQPIGFVSHHAMQQSNGQEEELLQQVQKLEAECLDKDSQVEYLSAVYEQSQARVLELEETERQSAGAQEQAQVLTARIQELEVALEESVGLVRKWEGAHSDGQAQVQDLEARVAHLHEHASEVDELKARIEEQARLIPELEAQGVAAETHAARVRELEEKHLEYTRSITNLEEQAKEDAKNAEEVHGDLKTKVALLEKSNGELQEALDLKSSRIAELEAEALTSVETSSSLSAEVAQLKETIQALRSSQATPAFDANSAHGGSVHSIPMPPGGLSSMSGIASSTSPDVSVRRMAMPASPPGGVAPMASPIRQIGISPIKGRTSPLAARGGMRVPGPVLGARVSTGEPKTTAAMQPANLYAASQGSSTRVVVPTGSNVSLSARAMQERQIQERRSGNISQPQGRWETPHRFASLQQPQPMLIRAMG